MSRQPISHGGSNIIYLPSFAGGRPKALAPGGGGGTYGTMETRVAKLESNVDHLLKGADEMRHDMRDVRDRLIGLEVKVDQLPGKGAVWGAAVAIVTAVALLTAFQGQIHAFVTSLHP